jgi:hypothetical protein
VYVSPATMTVTNLTITNNYAGVTGANTCFNLAPAATSLTISGNIVMENGTSWDSFPTCTGHGG